MLVIPHKGSPRNNCMKFKGSFCQNRLSSKLLDQLIRTIEEFHSRCSSVSSNSMNTASSDLSTFESNRRTQSEARSLKDTCLTLEYEDENINEETSLLDTPTQSGHIFNRPNYILKSDICKGVQSTNLHLIKTEKDNPILQYYNQFNLSNQSVEYEGNNYINKNYFRAPSTIEDINTSVYDENMKYSPMIKDRVSCSSTSTRMTSSSPQYYYQNNIDYDTKRSSYQGTMKASTNLNAINKANINVNSFLYLNQAIPNNSNKTPEQDNQMSSNYYGNYSDEALGELAVYLVKEQNGCRFIQDKIRKDPNFANNHLFSNLLQNMSDVICDSFGNYMFQILFEVLSEQNISIVISTIRNDIFKICFSSYGTRVIQKLIEAIKHNNDLLMQFNQLMTPQLIVAIAQDGHGNHIIQKYIMEIPYPKNNIIFSAIEGNFLEVAKTKHGCCIVQKCLKEANDIQKEQLISLVKHNLFSILSDQYGNYIFQYLIGYESPLIQYDTIKLILPQLITICKYKYSSNAIEKCFENSNPTIQLMILDQLLENESSIDELLLDPYGNYIIQKALMIAKGQNYSKLLHCVGRNINKLRSISFGAKLIAKLISHHQELGYIISNEQRMNDVHMAAYRRRSQKENI